jgi:hypothetical protein
MASRQGGVRLSRQAVDARREGRPARDTIVLTLCSTMIVHRTRSFAVRGSPALAAVLFSFSAFDLAFGADASRSLP